MFIVSWGGNDATMRGEGRAIIKLRACEISG